MREFGCLLVGFVAGVACAKLIDSLAQKEAKRAETLTESIEERLRGLEIQFGGEA